MSVQGTILLACRRVEDATASRRRLLAVQKRWRKVLHCPESVPPGPALPNKRLATISMWAAVMSTSVSSGSVSHS